MSERSTQAEVGRRMRLAAVKLRIEGVKRAMGRGEGATGRRGEVPAPLLNRLPALVGGLLGEWPALSEGERRTVVNALFAAVVVRVTPMPHPVPFVREVVEVRVQEWLGEFIPS